MFKYGPPVEINANATTVTNRNTTQVNVLKTLTNNVNNTQNVLNNVIQTVYGDDITYETINNTVNNEGDTNTTTNNNYSTTTYNLNLPPDISINSISLLDTSTIKIKMKSKVQFNDK
jgi:uncharacterized protein YycO